MIGILDLDMGNLRSVSNSVHSLGFEVEIVKTADRFHELSHLIIPGVGAYATAIKQVDALNLRQSLLEFAATKKPVLGICLGMEILSDFGDEGGPSTGLGLVAGKIERIPAAAGLSVPHVGWNNIEFKIEHPVFEKIKNGVDFYFVHSYHFACSSAESIYGVTQYGQSLCSVVGSGNVIGFQFHPEKSQVNGLRLLENFCNWNGQC